MVRLDNLAYPQKLIEVQLMNLLLRADHHHFWDSAGCAFAILYTTQSTVDTKRHLIEHRLLESKLHLKHTLTTLGRAHIYPNIGSQPLYNGHTIVSALLG